jgi:hypothetical protein
MLTLFGFQLTRILQMSIVSPSKRVAVIFHGRLFYIAGNVRIYAIAFIHTIYYVPNLRIKTNQSVEYL